MIQQESLPVWGYGRGMARTVARVTYIPGAAPPDPANPDLYTTLGAMKFTREGVGDWIVDVDVAGVTFYRYLAARIIYAGGAVLQANVTVENDPSVPPGSRLRVQILDPQGGPPGPDNPADLSANSALCIEAIVNQPGEPRYGYGPALVSAPAPAPAPRPPPDEPSDDTTTRIL